MSYTRNSILEKCEQALSDVKIFYQQEMLNYRGKTSDTEEYYSEVISEFVCNHIGCFKKEIPMITRKSSYKTDSHVGKVPTSNREEETIAIKMYNQSDKGNYVFPFIGKIIDYQTPLKSNITDIAGKVDLLSYDGNILRLLELKKPDSKETMLRCVLEAFTYRQTVDKEKLISDFGLPPDTEVVACPLVFVEGFQYQEMREDRKWLRLLMNLLNSKPYYIFEHDDMYDVMED